MPAVGVLGLVGLVNQQHFGIPAVCPGSGTVSSSRKNEKDSAGCYSDTSSRKDLAKGSSQICGEGSGYSVDPNPTVQTTEVIELDTSMKGWGQC